MTDIQHVDLVGNPIVLGGMVVSTNSMSSLAIFKVVKIATKTIRLKKLGASDKTKNVSRYPAGILALDEESMTMYFLKKGARK